MVRMPGSDSDIAYTLNLQETRHVTTYSWSLCFLHVLTTNLWNNDVHIMLQYSDVNHHNFQEHILKMRRFRRLC